MDEAKLERQYKTALKKIELLERLIEDKTRELYIAKEELKTANLYLQGVIQTVVDALVVVNREGKIQTVNKAAIDMLGISEDELVGESVEKIFFKGFVEGMNLNELVAKGFIKGIEKTYLTGAFKKIPVLFSSAVMKDNLNEVKGIVCVALDITERKEQEDRIRELAETDELTKIYNRRMYTYFLDIEMNKAKRYGRPFGLIMFDVDHFKAINDVSGHHTGDIVLQRVVDVARATVRGADIMVRYGGEEFMVIAMDTGLVGAAVLAEKIRGAISGHVIEGVGTVAVSVGVTEWRPDDTALSITKRVDVALYKAKKNGRNRVESA
ncbi:MAG: hypothetical protein A3J24_07510 [Deltaproteobacteria bacterium RIFCSPLOWO2_02_FULL_53_8]|nr:MAG: hypothetical protein A3J24_07510 [Deltaproteobacteria bacterium RIFCSPLOWO2_02_FULL_53_8]